MHFLSLKKIAEVVNGELLNSNKQISEIVTDSRNIDVHNSDQSVFFAIHGMLNDGHNYIDKLYKIGVKAFVISKNINFKQYPDAGFIKVDDSIKALQKLGAFKRSLVDIPVVGITGSNGKTIVKEWLSFILMNYYNITRSPKSYNSQIGVPLSLWMLDSNTELGIIEAGISKPGEMNVLQEIIKPQVGILTNIGKAHQQNFLDLSQKIEEKLKLFKNCEKIVYCSDDENVNKQIQELTGNIKRVSWSFQETQSTVFVKSIEQHTGSTTIRLKLSGDDYSVIIPFIDRGSIENAITVFATLIALEIEITDKIIEKFSLLPVVEMRLEILDGINNSTIINDSYNSDINSLKIAIDFLMQKKGNKSPVLVLSDILQNIANEENLYSHVAELIRKKNIDKFIGVGPALKRNMHFFGDNAEFYINTDELLGSLKYNEISNSCILLKGARSFSFERVCRFLQKKTHETVIEIDFNAMKHNLDYFKRKVSGRTKIMAVVKAFSYGSGYHEISLFLEHNNIDYLAVAYADEGVELRNHGINVPIMVMNPGLNSLNAIIDYKLEPEIYSVNLLKSLVRHLDNIELRTLQIHLKLDTGMHRLGIKENELDEVISILKTSSKIKVVSIFSHLIGSGNPGHDQTTKQQIDLYNSMYNYLSEGLKISPLKHVSNTMGIIRFPEYNFDMVRLGIGLYGLVKESSSLMPVSTFKTIISQIHKINKGETVSYDCSGQVKRDSLIATIPVGYADGLDRRLGNGNWSVIVRDKKAETIGDICMDMTMLDVSDIDGVKEGDEVIVFGKKNRVTEMAEILETIPYEVITKISERVKRVYLQE